jgi:hypothetical protein
VGLRHIETCRFRKIALLALEPLYANHRRRASGNDAAVGPNKPLSALHRSLMRGMKLRWDCGAPVLLKVFACRLDIARKDLGHILVQMRAHDDPQAVDLLGVPGSQSDGSSFFGLFTLGEISHIRI